jgi:hypothetical protein
LVTRAAEAELLMPLFRRLIQHRISLYADDVALFIQPTAADISLTLRFLELFGDASGQVKCPKEQCAANPLLLRGHVPHLEHVTL